jgi:hypothetical protein
MQVSGSKFQANSFFLIPDKLRHRSGIRNQELKGLAVLAHLAQAKLDQMLGFESAAGPTISILKLDSKEVVGFCKFAIFYSGLAVFALEL